LLRNALLFFVFFFIFLFFRVVFVAVAHVVVGVVSLALILRQSIWLYLTPLLRLSDAEKKKT
jgi:hypothetical protein